MQKINDLIEWDYLGAHYSIYIKHFSEEHGHKGMTLIFEDVTHEKVTEMVIPPRVFPAFLKAVNAGMDRYKGLF